jgi:hypothetical protein
MRAALLLPPLWMALLMLGIHRATRILLPLTSATIMATVLALTTPALWNYFSEWIAGWNLSWFIEIGV